jgi:hypothetical protein
MATTRFQNPDQIQHGQEIAEMSQPPVPIQSSAMDQLMRIDGVEGTGHAQDDQGNEVIVAYLRDASVATQLPATIDGKAVKFEITGKISAQPV